MGRKRLLRPFVIAAIGYSCSAPPTVETFDTEIGVITVTTVASGLDHPWGLAFLPDGRMLVTERPGRLRIVTSAGVVSDPLTGVPDVWARGQGGLLDVALAPDFETSSAIYLTYAEPGEGNQARTAAGRAVLETTGLRDFHVIFRQTPTVSSRVHFGSRIVFSGDGTVFITTGERGRRDDSQDLTRHMGKVIRINLDGSIPNDNPFVGHPSARPEIWSYGHRNIQGATFDQTTGQLWTVEHGAMGGDEINTPRAGRNYGWPVITYGIDYSGDSIGIGPALEGMEQPIHYWDPSIAPSGLTFYTGDPFSGWKGNLLVGSLKFGLLVRLELEGGQVIHEERMLDGLGDRVRHVVQGPDGMVYILTDEGNGRILRLAPAP